MRSAKELTGVVLGWFRPHKFRMLELPLIGR
jgi:hypothetical protein